MKSLKLNSGIAMPIVMGLIFCLAVWVASLSWTMTNSRSRYQQVIKLKKAYFMSRSALQHFFLKIKTVQRQFPGAMKALEEANKDEWGKLSGIFVEDIVVPADNSYTGEKFSYRIKDFSIDSVDYENSRLTIQIKAEGNFGGEKNEISRLLRVSR